MSLKAILVSGLITSTTTLVSATSLLLRDHGPGGSGYGGYGGGFDNSRGSPADYLNGQGEGPEPEINSPSDISRFNSLNYSKAANARIAHAALASLAFIVLFPLGAICIRIPLPGKVGLILHGLFQLFAYLVYTAAVGLGIWLCVYVRFDGYHLLTNYHPIIGLVLFCLLFFQPIGGILHHLGFKRHGQRTAISYGHIWGGRILITLGMINGGLGLKLADNATRGECIAYGVIAGLMWLIWMTVAVLGEMRRSKTKPIAVDKVANGSNGHGHTGEKDSPAYA